MSTNITVLCGRLTKDPLLQKTPTGTSVVSINLAVDRKYKADNHPTVDFISVQVWNKTAEYLCNYGIKGSLLNVVGRISTRNYEDQSGKKVYVTEVIAEEIQILNSKSKKENEEAEFVAISETHEQNSDKEVTF